MHILMQTWSEPCDGSAVYFLFLPPEEIVEVQADIAWLDEHGGNEIGEGLSYWTLTVGPKAVITQKDDSVFRSLEATRLMMARESRYEEDPSFYGDEPYPPYAAIAGPSYWLPKPE